MTTSRPETFAALVAMWEAAGVSRSEAERLAGEQLDPVRMAELRDLERARVEALRRGSVN